MSKCLEVPLNVLVRHRFTVVSSSMTRIEAKKERLESDVTVSAERTPAGWVYETKNVHRITRRAYQKHSGVSSTLLLAISKICLAEGGY